MKKQNFHYKREGSVCVLDETCLHMGHKIINRVLAPQLFISLGLYLVLNQKTKTQQEEMRKTSENLEMCIRCQMV